MNRKKYSKELKTMVALEAIKGNQPVDVSPFRKKKKVLRIISRLNIGGPAIHVKILFEAFNNQEFESQLIIGKVSEHEGDMEYLVRSSNGTVQKISSFQRDVSIFKDIITLLYIVRIIARTRPHIVHTHMAKAGVVGRVAAIICNFILGSHIKLVHTFHGHVFDGYFKDLTSRLFITIEKLLALFTDKVISISNTQKWELTKKYTIASGDKIEIINLGFDLMPFTESVRYKGEYRKSLGIGEGTLLVGIVGRLVPIKNHIMFLDATRHFVARNIETPVIFSIIGNGELRSTLESYVRDIGLEEYVYFHGWEKNTPLIYADLDFLALTSNNEGTPVSIIEAMAAKVPVITTAVGGATDLLGKIEQPNYQNEGFSICDRGILCPKNNPIAFSKGMSHLSNGIRSKEPKGQIVRAHDYVLEHYSDKRLVGNIDRLYNALLD